MDFKGQQLAESLAMYMLVGFAAIAFLVGYLRQDFGSMMTLFGSGCAVACVVAVPDWPVYNKHPIQWLPAKGDAAGGKQQKRGGGGGGGVSAVRRKKVGSWSNLWGMF